MKKILIPLLLVFLGFFSGDILAQSVDGITIAPDLDIARFAPYTVTAQISDYGTTNPVNIGISGLNGDGGPYWDYYADGSAYPRVLNFPMQYVSGIGWTRIIYPDYIYPQIVFAPSEVTWYNTPSNLTVRRNDYHILHIYNPFSVASNMNFWIEINATPKAANSADLQVYLVKKGKNISFFNSDWVSNVGSSDVELVGTISRTASFSHTHNNTSNHHLIAVTTNSDGTVGNKHIDISSDFWIVVYNTSPNVNRGWDLRYHGTNLCTNNNLWYRGNISGWTTTAQIGCPDTHIHMLRRSVEVSDSVKLFVTAGLSTANQSFSYGALPNLPPNATRFVNPVGGAHAGNLNISWDPASDPNNDTPLTYFLYLLDAGGSVVSTLSTGTTATSLIWNTTSVANSTYGIGASVCDPSSLCANFNTDLDFSINNNVAAPISSLSSIYISSNNVGSTTTALNGDSISLELVTSGTITTAPTVNFFVNGNQIAENRVFVFKFSDYIWTASFEVNSSDVNGEVTFTISSPQLDAEYYQTTDSSYVSIDNPLPTSTPTPTPTNTPIPTNTPMPTNTPTPTPTTTLTPTNTPIPTSIPTATPTPPITSRTITDLTSNTMQNEVINGYISIGSLNPTSVPNFTFNLIYTFLTGQASVVFPKDTVVTPTDGDNLDLTTFSIIDNTIDIGNELPLVLGSIRVGVPSVNLTFSKPVTISIPVGASKNGQTLTAYYRFENSTEWNVETTCLIADGNCTFETTHATTFAVKDKETVSSSPSSSANTSVVSNSSFFCRDEKPLFIPDLFEINTTRNSAKLFFTPLADTADFFVSFSQNPLAEEHGEQVTLIREGVQSHSIYHLKPNTVYYAKVRGQNGCMPGDWSNTVKFKTDSKIYYKKFPAKKINNPKTVKPYISTLIKSEESISPVQITTLKPNPMMTSIKTETKTETKKKCFLWWCW